MAFIRSTYDADVRVKRERKENRVFTHDSAPADDFQVRSPIVISCIYNVHYLEVASKHHSCIFVILYTTNILVYNMKLWTMNIRIKIRAQTSLFLGAFTSGSHAAAYVYIYSYVAHHNGFTRSLSSSPGHYTRAHKAVRIVTVNTWQSPHQKWRQHSYGVIKWTVITWEKMNFMLFR